MTDPISLPPLAPAPPHTPIYVRFHLWLYRTSGGRLGGNLRGLRFLILTTAGRKTSARYAVPLEYHTDSQPPYTPYVIASNYGKDKPPAWYLNLQANPAVEIEWNGRRQQATASVVTGAGRQRLWDELARVAPHYARYQRRTSREIPLVLLRPLELG